ncbi:hypothetical protein C5F49_06810 [Nitrosopumilus oxyclinae]|uniref:Uncharacterized protein n=1 Tax=Nitrosopumilus oxyclinae TaxID=1959104 RepID=A0A7D5R5B5_9ARCH|nr:hypothetical protein [Nitrosopumilus oxyclinae]QLH05059.1 hypothetical protein C5F49_06810 [Nitrosopumilus oxyclinae]
MTLNQAITQLQISNQGIEVILDNLDGQLADIRRDPRLECLVDDLENLFHSYLKTWMKSNNEVLDILKK